METTGKSTRDSTLDRTAAGGGWRARRACLMLGRRKYGRRARRCSALGAPRDRKPDPARRLRHPREPLVQQPVHGLSRSDDAELRLRSGRQQDNAALAESRHRVGHLAHVVRVLHRLRRNGPHSRNPLQAGRVELGASRAGPSAELRLRVRPQEADPALLEVGTAIRAGRRGVPIEPRRQLRGAPIRGGGLLEPRGRRSFGIVGMRRAEKRYHRHADEETYLRTENLHPASRIRRSGSTPTRPG